MALDTEAESKVLAIVRGSSLSKERRSTALQEVRKALKCARKGVDPRTDDEIGKCNSPPCLPGGAGRHHAFLCKRSGKGVRKTSETEIAQYVWHALDEYLGKCRGQLHDAAVAAGSSDTTAIFSGSDAAVVSSGDTAVAGSSSGNTAAAGGISGEAVATSCSRGAVTTDGSSSTVSPTIFPDAAVAGGIAPCTPPACLHTGEAARAALAAVWAALGTNTLGAAVDGDDTPGEHAPPTFMPSCLPTFLPFYFPTFLHVQVHPPSPRRHPPSVWM